MSGDKPETTALGAEMLRAMASEGYAIRYCRGAPAERWRVGEARFHEFTGDALARRNLIEHCLLEHDGNHYDRFKMVECANGKA